MIVLTRLNGERFGINDEQIERLESGHDTSVLLVTGNRYTVTETIDEIIDLIVDFRGRVFEEREGSHSRRNAKIAAFRPLPQTVTED